MLGRAALFLLLGACAAKAPAREFVGWSDDGSKLLLYEPRPRRLVALDVPGLHEVWSLYGAADGSLPPAVRELGFKVESLSRRKRLEMMSGPAGTTVTLEGESWVAKIAGRAPAFASEPVTGYPTSYERRAYVLPDERLVPIVPIIEIDLTPGWHPMVAGDTASYGSDDHAMAELNAVVSRGEARALRSCGETLSGWLTRLHTEDKWREVGAPESGAGWARGRAERGETKIVEWALESGDDLIWISYTDRSWPPAELEPALDRMARSARVRRE
jgi:hypothetical protein